MKEVQPLQSIADPTRQRILQLVWTHEQSAGDIAAHFPSSFGAVSQHLRILRDAGFVELRKAGRQRFYKARRESLGPLAAYLEQTWGLHLELLKEAAEKAEHA